MDKFLQASSTIFLALLLPAAAFPQSRLLDDFETLNGWKPIVSEGAHLLLTPGPGKTGKAMVMNFDLSGVYGYVIAEKDFSFDLPPDYQFTFDMRAEAPVNNFEFKLYDDKDNVWWIKKLNITYPAEWERQRIAKRHLTFAWGPSRTNEIRTVRKIQFVVSVGTGGKGKVFIDNFRFEPIDDQAVRNARAEILGEAGKEGVPRIDPAGTMLTPWNTSAGHDSLVIDFHCQKEVGGVVIDWDTSHYATAYDVYLSDDGADWSRAYSVAHGNGGRDYVYLHEGEGRFLKLDFTKSNAGTGYSLRQVQIKGYQFSASPNEFFKAIAADARPGLFPRYLLNKQSFWTVMGVNGDTKEALMNEQGQIELEKLGCSLEPFVYVEGKLVTWNDVKTTPSLMRDYLPIPSVTWESRHWGTLQIEAFAAGVPEKSLLGIQYRLQSKLTAPFKLFIAVRPFQVNPPWQQLNVEGGVARIDSIRVINGIVEANGVKIIPMTAPAAFGAAEFDNGQITEYLEEGVVPASLEATDHFGHASAAFEYDFNLRPDEEGVVTMAMPFHAYRGSPKPAMGQSAEIYYSLMRSTTIGQLERKLENIRITLPPSAPPVMNTIRSQLSYIFINRDGPGIQPGSRSYERSWIRDGALTCAALLRTGNGEEVREFIDWYAKGQFPSGKIPCVIDARGPDAVSENDSHGEFIYAVAEYFRFAHDTTWLRGKFEAIARDVHYIQSLRAERKTDRYRNGTPEQRACFGLVPESISHEGYWDVPRHSYWDDFFTLKGLKDAVLIAGALGEKKLETEWAAERDDFRNDLYASMRLAMRNKNIDYIPGCVELGDFDATSTTIGVYPCGELGNIPEPQLHNTFDRYYKFFRDRETTGKYENYTPYEVRTIGTFALLGQKSRVADALNFFMKDQRPPEWSQWQEVVWKDPETPKFIGDSPHSWVGSDFIRSAVAMFVYDRESDGAHVLAGGIPDAWIADSAGVQVQGIPTFYGLVGYAIKKKGRTVAVDVSGSFDAPHHTLVLKNPMSGKVSAVKLNGKRVSFPKSGELVLPKLPARAEFIY
ncbi:MAG TPA: discoidin domain-containing protein [Bacteroidota bacterium]